jgi:transcriptional regulator with XRE-family HTH domain
MSESHIVRFNGDRLEELRLDRKWDQHELAQRARAYGVGITQSQVSRYENGQEPSGRNAMALAGALEVDARELYAGSPEDPEDRLRHPSLSADLQRLAQLAGILERRPDLLEDVLAAEAEEARS